MSIKNKKHILIGITGGIAAYKSLSLIRLFIKAGCEVKVAATRNALQFVTPLSIETLSQNKLYHDSFAPIENIEVGHVTWADWADAFVVAPCSANMIGKLTHGIADDALSTLLLAYNKILFIAPAMNDKMYCHPAVQENLKTLINRGVRLIEPASGFLACGTEGKGRMEEPETIAETVLRQLNANLPLSGKKVLVTAGPTYEPIDPVRFIGNHSSGLMGFALAEQFAEQGAEVILIAGPTYLNHKHSSIQRINIMTAQEMLVETMNAFPQVDITVMAAAVADYTPSVVADEKIKKKESHFSLDLHKTTDILSELGKIKSEKQYLAGFALETENEKENAIQKLQNKKLDLIVLNSMKTPGAGFKTTTNQVIIITKDGREMVGCLKGKDEVASDIIQFIIQELHLN
ncbi:MAG: bifunctional phosphopantothenoylcysteine decarboxylase/phosphopantothenate--cysteine ligase CoaBC [Bacteroidales bacterium]|jgi:phosphopantothenoylcysteine decarboxylase/phosphopantothenate--cysteine ligase|nr:bifunctional phosphopantothenoylcysteine decarboxylase/phosphopantothenate--cysteine ligase CoaBC [Bacteroidales bacterium]